MCLSYVRRAHTSDFDDGKAPHCQLVAAALNAGEHHEVRRRLAARLAAAERLAEHERRHPDARRLRGGQRVEV